MSECENGTTDTEATACPVRFHRDDEDIIATPKS